MTDAVGSPGSVNGALYLEPSACVAMTIDMQRQYLDPEVGTKLMPQDSAHALLHTTARFLTGCRLLGVPIVHCYVTRRRAEVDMGKDPTRFHAAVASSGDGPDRLEGTAGAEVPGVLVAPTDLHITAKKTMDSFYGTDLEYLLGRVLRPTTVLLTGINTETCVYSAVFGTSIRGYRPVVVRDCVGTRRAASNGQAALRLMSDTIAWVLSADEVIAKLTDAA